VRLSKAQRWKWWGYIHKMEECRMVRWIPVGKRSRGHQIDGGLKSEGYWSIGYEILDKGGDGQIGLA